MGDSTHLRARAFRTILRLVGECRDLGSDPIAWRLHLLTELCAELGARVGAGGESTGFARGQFLPISTVDVGWENDAQRQAMFEWMEVQARTPISSGLRPLTDPTHESLVVRGVTGLYQDDQSNLRDRFYDCFQRAGLADLMVSHQRISFDEDRCCGLTVMRDPGEVKFSDRDKTFLVAVHCEIAPLVGRQLASAQEPSRLELSPRRRQVLDCLLEGDSEKQIAARLGLTTRTVNQYVKAVYRHFHVNSRAELMARWIRFDRSSRLPNLDSGGPAAPPPEESNS